MKGKRPSWTPEEKRQIENLYLSTAPRWHKWLVWPFLGICLVVVIFACIGFVHIFFPTGVGSKHEQPVPISLSDKAFELQLGYEPPPLESASSEAERDFLVRSAVVAARAMWSQYFNASYMPAEYAAVNMTAINGQEETFKSGCNKTAPLTKDHAYFFYCGIDGRGGTVWLSSGAIALAAQPKAIGMDGRQYTPMLAAAAAGVYTYSSQTIEQLNLWTDLPPLEGANHALVATCFTGAWLRATYPNTSLEDQAASLGAITRLVGPKRPSASPVQLRDALVLGMQTAKPLNCIQAYWPNAPEPSPSG